MTSPRDVRGGPQYFFDQPTGRGRPEDARINVSPFNLAKGARFAAAIRSTDPENERARASDRDAQSGAHGTSHETRGGDEREHDTSSSSAAHHGGALRSPSEGMDDHDDDPVAAYRRAAPPLLEELALLLEWTAEGERGVPRGLLNILSYSWRDLAAAAERMLQLRLKSPDQTDKRPKFKAARNFDETVSANEKKKSEKRRSGAVGNAAPPETHVHSHVHVKKTISTDRGDLLISSHSAAVRPSTTITFSMASKSCKERGWIIEPQKPYEEPQEPYEEPQETSLCQWVVERLQMAQIPIKLQTAKLVEQGLNQPAVLRHYGEATPCMKDRVKRAQSITLVNGTPRIPEVKPVPLVNGIPRIPEVKPIPLVNGTPRIPEVKPVPLVNGIPRIPEVKPVPLVNGTPRIPEVKPVPLVNGMPRIPEVKLEAPAQQKLHYRINDGSSIVYYPSGRVAVCQSHSALPHGGFYTNVFSDDECPLILASSTAFGRGAVTHPVSGTITAAWNKDGGLIMDSYGTVTKEWRWQTKQKIVIKVSDLISVQLFSGTSALLSFRSGSESVKVALSALSDVTLLKETTEERFTDAAREPLPPKKRKHPGVVIESKRDLTAVSPRSPEVLQMVREADGLEERKERGYAGRELRRLQQRVRNTVEDWLEFYRRATGIRCPDIDAPLRTRRRREVQSAAPTSVNPPGPEEGRQEDLVRHLPGSSSSFTLLRTPQQRTKKKFYVVQIGALRIRSTMRLDSVTIPRSPESQPPAVIHCPVQPMSSPSAPLSLCPVLLRAALLGEEGRRLCCCSSTLMPPVTDVEYDAFVVGQPPHSQQMLVVCVTPPPRPPGVTHTPDTLDTLDMLEQLYQRMNKRRIRPCTQCQMDSFRMVKYEMSTAKCGCGAQNSLLQHRHNAAPGMVLMYIRGKLLFADYIINGNGSVRDFHKQMSRTRRDYKSGLSLPPDYKSRMKMQPETRSPHNPTQH